jgi:DNA-binding IscR family transcriptional regulator
VLSNRGPQGGHLLGRPAEQIALRDVLVTLEGGTTPIDHILSLPCSIEFGTAHCVIREVYLEVKKAVEDILAATTLAQMAARQRRLLDEQIEVPRDLEAGPYAALPVVEG